MACDLSQKSSISPVQIPNQIKTQNLKPKPQTKTSNPNLKPKPQTHTHPSRSNSCSFAVTGMSRDVLQAFSASSLCS
jgi:hypothetical protein